MTICFTLPYSSGGCEERRIKSDLLTAIMKCSLLASIKACRLLLTWLTLMQPRGACTLPFSSPALLCHPLEHACVCVCVCVCVRVHLCVSFNLVGMKMLVCLRNIICFEYLPMERGKLNDFLFFLQAFCCN